MFVIGLKKRTALAGTVCVLVAFLAGVCIAKISKLSALAQGGGHFIKYAKFEPTYEALDRAMKEDIKSQSEDLKLNWIEILSILACKYGGNFKKYKSQDIDEIIQKMKSGVSASEMAGNSKNYNYYKEVYTAVLKEFVGKYKIKKPPKREGEPAVWQEAYGLKAFSPIAKTFPFAHYDDFGASRSYGYSRPHLGHDMMAAVGCPVVAVESGTVEIMGWNQYGGWRVGIRSFDKKRYYYYAHLRQNRPFHADLKEGKIVNAGDVIGYVGRTGYSTKENVNNIDKSHLHWGMQLIFDESQKECDNEIWIDLYAITKLLEKNKSAVIRNSETKEFYAENEFCDENIENAGASV